MRSSSCNSHSASWQVDRPPAAIKSTCCRSKRMATRAVPVVVGISTEFRPSTGRTPGREHGAMDDGDRSDGSKTKRLPGSGAADGARRPLCARAVRSSSSRVCRSGQADADACTARTPASTLPVDICADHDGAIEHALATVLSREMVNGPACTNCTASDQRRSSPQRKPYTEMRLRLASQGARFRSGSRSTHLHRFLLGVAAFSRRHVGQAVATASPITSARVSQSPTVKVSGKRMSKSPARIASVRGRLCSAT